MGEELDQRRFWQTMFTALGAELRESSEIQGISGLNHQVQAIAVDDTTQRVIIASAEPNPRTAALMQVDVQATMPGARVLVARPITFDIGEIGRRILQPLGINEIDIKEAKSYLAELKPDSKLPINDDLVKQIIEGAFQNPTAFALPAIPIIQGLIEQASTLPWKQIMGLFEDSVASGTLDLRGLLSADSLASDFAAGVCPIPLYSFDPDDMDLFQRGANIEFVRERLKALDIYQYFFPPSDQVALGIIDHGIADVNAIVTTTEQAPKLGHIFDAPELVDPTASLIDQLEQLKGLGYVAEGEQGIEISESGRTVRSTVKFKPREGLINKLLNRVSVSISPKDFM